MPPFPDFSRGKEWSEFSAEEWNALRLAVMQFANLDVAPPLQLSKSGDRAMLSVDPQLIQTPVRHITILVTKTPTEDDVHLHIRQVRYMDIPPQSGRYEWATDDIRGFPDFGAELLDYEQLVWLPDLPGETRDGPPDVSSPFLRARSFEGLWIVELQVKTGGSNEIVVVARSFDEPGSRFITVQEIKPSLDNDEWTGAFEVTGDPIVVAVWPTMVAGDFTPFLWPGDTLSDLMTPLPLFHWHGAWWLKQRPKLRVSQRHGPIKIADCTGIEGGG